jgi:RNA polymerase sigma factor (sigma-70 family)
LAATDSKSRSLALWSAYLSLWFLALGSLTSMSFLALVHISLVFPCLYFLFDKNVNKKRVELPDLDGGLQDSNPFNDESLKLLFLAIKKLSELDRAIILLYLEENSYQEIAEIMGLSSNNIGVKITRIKKKLKTLLDGKIY